MKFQSKSPTKFWKAFLEVPKREDQPDIFKISAENLWEQYRKKEDRMPIQTTYKRSKTALKLKTKVYHEGRPSLFILTLIKFRFKSL